MHTDAKERLVCVIKQSTVDLLEADTPLKTKSNQMYVLNCASGMVGFSY